ncbi:MAG: AMP-binding protein [Burkholderiaceae bacterium]|nr:AMP-binding protein [Sulfuritalea sp.]MCF8175692.1 AMP-binding protein [Burkholderiaceae bacterium]
MEESTRTFPSVVHMLAAASNLAPQREALVCDGERLTYAEYQRCVAWFAHELIDLGASGQRVGIVLGNSLDICIALFAVHAARAQVVPLNPQYTGRELRAIFQDADLHVVIFAQEQRGIVEPIADELKIPHRICIGRENRCLADWRNAADRELPPMPLAEDLATLQFTGGTTGRAKGVNLTHGAVAFNISQRAALLPARMDRERLLCVMPLFHVYAVAMCLHNMVHARGTMVILPRYAPQTVFDLLARERITAFAGSPTLFAGLLAAEGFGQADFSELQLSYSGSSALPEGLLRRWEAATGAPIMEGYGQSEAGPVVSFNPLQGIRKPGSVGVPLPDTEVEIVDLEQGTQILAAGEQGEIRLRGPQLMSGYRNLPEETAASLRDGWLYTGDIGEFDADGYLFIRDRKKEMAKVSGYNVFPREIEDVFYLHPAVQEAAVVAVPDAYRGEVVRAFVVLRPDLSATPQQLAEHCEANLAKYKWPARISVVAELPKTGVGKIDKNQLRGG